MVRDFAEHEVAPVIKDFNSQHRYPRPILAKLAELGVLGMTVPPEFGGTQTDSLSLALALEELSYVSPALAVIVSVHCSLFCHSIVEFGTLEQKTKYLPAAARGEIIGAFSLTEPGAGSDATNLKTKAERRGEAYILNGRKAWVTSGSEAEALVVFCHTDIEPGKKRLSAFIVEKDFPGFHVARLEEKMGLECSLTAELVFENCPVPAENLLGEEGHGASIAFRGLDSSRIGVAAQAVGLSQRAMEEAVRYSKLREAFGQKISDFEAVQFMIADTATLTDASRLLTYNAYLLRDQGLPFSKEASMAKLFASEAANKIAYLALQIHGGYGYSKEFAVERIYRDARVLPLYEGTSEIQRIVIARNLLKE